MALALPHHKFTGDEYAQMIATGILAEDDRVELIRGEIITMSPIGPIHVNVVGLLTSIIARQTTDAVLVHSQSPIWLPDDSQPQPDLAIIRAGYDTRRLPTPADVLLVIEVADTSLAYARQVKVPLYAAAGIPEAWIVNLTARRVERYSEPRADGYMAMLPVGTGGTISSTIVPDITLAVDAMFR